MPALKGEYYTPFVSQMRINHPGKLSAPLNLPIFLGQELVPSTERSIGSIFQLKGALATHTEEAVRSAVIQAVRGAVCELLRVHWLWGRNECHIKTHKRTISSGAF